jgi:signal transduction histidine kinase
VGAVAGLLFGSLIVTLLADIVALPAVIEDAVDLSATLALVAIPFAVLIALLRGRYARAMAVSGLVERVGRAAQHRRGLRDALADALGDPELQLAYWLPEREQFVDAAGRPVAVTDTCVRVEREERVVGAIRSTAEPELVQGVAAAAALAMENERLEAELRARIEELRESRARLVEAGDAERRRLERDLHDGAQQRLVALALTLRLARAKAGDGEAAEMIEAAAAELAQATAELRELARGIHPAVLTDRGLLPAVDALAARAPLPVEVEGVPAERLPAGVEAAAYFLVAEALTNVSRYAAAEHAEVRMERQNGTLVVEVRDDGVGGADPAAGSGLRGLADRLAALDGRLEVRSPQGAGTVVRAEVPCAS